MAFRRPPKGYRKMEYPLPHNFEYHFNLDFLDLTRDATMVTLFRGSETTNAADTIVANPAHPSFLEDTGPTVIMGSIIPKVMVSIKMNLPQVVIADNEFGSLVVNVMPLYFAFKDTLEAINSGPPETEVEEILEMQHAAVPKRTNPLWSGIDLSSNLNHPLSTVTDTDVATTDWLLTTDAKLESVAFDDKVYYDSLQYYSNAGMVRKVTGRKQSFVLRRDRTAHMFSNNFTYPMVKRINSYTYCGILIWTTTPGTTGSYGESGDWNPTDLDLVHFNVQVRFDEWNADFDQTTV